CNTDGAFRGELRRTEAEATSMMEACRRDFRVSEILDEKQFSPDLEKLWYTDINGKDRGEGRVLLWYNVFRNIENKEVKGDLGARHNHHYECLRWSDDKVTEISMKPCSIGLIKLPIKEEVEVTIAGFDSGGNEVSYERRIHTDDDCSYGVLLEDKKMVESVRIGFRIEKKGRL
ncbi:hypothetical protein HAX54_026776, partial [Datura stramonium]|nr:hypothetical protein [Datura stramonium]